MRFREPAIRRNIVTRLNWLAINNAVLRVLVVATTYDPPARGISIYVRARLHTELALEAD